MQTLALGTRITISNSGTLCWYNCLYSCTIDWGSDLGWKVILRKNKTKCWFIFNCDQFPNLIHGETANSCTSTAELSGRVLLMLVQLSKDCLVYPWSEEITEEGIRNWFGSISAKRNLNIILDFFLKPGIWMEFASLWRVTLKSNQDKQLSPP